MVQKTGIELNEKYNPPSFDQTETVILKKDCYSYNLLPEIETECIFKKNCKCEIYQCGLSHFYVDENEQFIEHVEDCEWCSVELREEGDEDDISISGLIRVKDLEKFYP